MSSIENIPEVEIIETEEIELKNPLILTGFSGPGLVGLIANRHIIEQLDLQEIAYIKTRHIRPAVVFIDGTLRHPFRIYANKDGDLCVIICEIPFNYKGIFPISSKIVDWTEKHDAKEIIILGSIALRGIPKERKTYFIAGPERSKDFDNNDSEAVSSGIIQGIAGGLLNECLARKISGLALLTPAPSFMPDPEGAATVIQKINKFYDLNVNVEDLLNKADDIKQRLKEMAQKHKKIREEDNKGQTPQGLYA
ncbi:MAG: proteasome assembly chaperone family protein [Candidatus Lokiarchaeota archaeon]|nr:proteasome assembly chaperone family protein [Candidatus Lokiarchaeota archaeon]